MLKTPHAVVLLDEMEKAHPDIFNLLLQIMDYGTLTDAVGRSVSFRDVILIMTSNAGAFEMDQAAMGFTRQDHSSDGAVAVKRLFTPEFRNRLDAIVNFHALNEEAVLAIVDKFITRIQAQLEPRGVQLKVDKATRQWLAERGFSSSLGARPMQRLITRHLKQPILDDLLFGALKKGGVVRFTPQGDTLECSVQSGRKRSRKTGLKERV